MVDLLECLHSEGRTIVMVTHGEEYTKHCDRVIFMEDGLVVREKKLK